MVAALADKGWALLPFDAALADWAAAARGAAEQALSDPALAHWHQCEGTWFVGVDALDNDAEGRINGSGPLHSDGLARMLGPMPALHRGQLSVIRPGYPRPRLGETEAGFRYRKQRDAAHVDGVLAIGADKRRQVREPHDFILGLPLNMAIADAAPLVVWEGSHILMREAFAAAFAAHPGQDWSEVDVTEAYVAARRKVFDTCRRVPLPARPGEATLLHRLSVHRVAPWSDGASADPEGRMIAYFRPVLAGGVAAWISQP